MNNDRAPTPDHESSEEDFYDWADSHIFMHISNIHQKLL